MDESQPDAGESTYCNSNTNWTPSLVVKAFCGNNELVSDFKEISAEGKPHDPTFTYRLKIGDIEKTASGHSKKKARHAAALKALPELSQQYSDIPGLEDVLNSSEFDVEPQPKEANPVSKLQEFCTKKRYTQPMYEENSDQTSELIFTVECQLEKHDLHAVGVGKSKKLAKRIAAAEILKILEEMKLYDPLASSSANKATKDDTDDSNDIAKDGIDDFYRNIVEEYSFELSEVFANNDQADDLDILQEVAYCIKCKPKWMEITQVSLMEEQVGDVSYVVHLIPRDRSYKSRVPILSAWGTGPDHLEAKLKAAKTWVFMFKQIYSSFAIKHCNPLDECWD